MRKPVDFQKCRKVQLKEGVHPEPMRFVGVPADWRQYLILASCSDTSLRPAVSFVSKRDFPSRFPNSEVQNSWRIHVKFYTSQSRVQEPYRHTSKYLTSQGTNVKSRDKQEVSIFRIMSALLIACLKWSNSSLIANSPRLLYGLGCYCPPRATTREGRLTSSLRRVGLDPFVQNGMVCLVEQIYWRSSMTNWQLRLRTRNHHEKQVDLRPPRKENLLWSQVGVSCFCVGDVDCSSEAVTALATCHEQDRVV